MLAKLRPRSVYDVMAAIACFGVVAGGTAYAANTIGSADVIDNSLVSEDIKNETIRGGDIQPGTITGTRLADQSLNSAKVKDNTLTGDDINESSLGTVPGSSSGRIVMRARGGSQTASNTPAPYPVTNASWSQVPGESAVLFGEASFTSPANCEPPPSPGGLTPGIPSVSLILRLDGDVIQILGSGGSVFTHFVFERPTGAARTLTAELHDNCTAGHFTVDSLAVNAFGMR